MTYAGSMTLTTYMKKWREQQRVQSNDEKGKAEMRTIRALPQDVTEKIFLQATQGLAHLHRWQVCHRDLKPDNLIVSDEENELRVGWADFGLATMVCGSNHALHDCVGTLPFVAPEILWDETGSRKGYCGFKADVWSLAVTFVDLAWGHRQIEQSLGWFPRAPEKSDKKAIALRKLPEMWSQKPCPASYATITPVVSGLLQVDPSARWPISQAERYLASLNELQQGSSILASTVSMPPGSQNPLIINMGWQNHFRQDEVVDRNENIATSCPAVMTPSMDGMDMQELMERAMGSQQVEGAPTSSFSLAARMRGGKRTRSLCNFTIGE
eukprot:gnl/TRDRNA2_/TRDRNA2_167300_c0_seq1.p1 gnl/TRDRNA2_/TRDRNA2_167300_c0~~gnl/TRDRNA2_/TRDRNA2_167300_c0_seq1.p1  ORF type:complete len:357 (-),score=47.82 gnl/TRDRNA2_/TRDRNA2_167300_c0_seq1:307-1284(-)